MPRQQLPHEPGLPTVRPHSRERTCELMAGAGVHCEPVRCSLTATTNRGISERRQDAQHGEASEDDHHRPVVLLLSLQDRDDDGGNDHPGEKSWRLASATKPKLTPRMARTARRHGAASHSVMSMYRVACVT